MVRMGYLFLAYSLWTITLQLITQSADGSVMASFSREISLCMIVKDEERTLSRSLDSVASLAPEVVIVDTGSADRTCEIAASYGAKPAPFAFSQVDFAAARNYALSLASGRWILVLDADETVDPASVPLIRQLVAHSQNAGYYLERINRRCGSGTSTTDHVVRLFPNRPNYRYAGRVHETVDASILAGGGRLVPTGIRLNHLFASKAEERRRKNLWYIQILNEEIAADPGDASRLVFLAAEYHQLGMFAKAAEVTERLQQLRPCDPQAHLHAGMYHLLYTSNLRQARQDFLEALRLRPGYAEALSFLGLLEKREGEAGMPQSAG
jgi:glycosyltransferase involved in cell wall biosynthesis